ncbi:MAG: Calx-beta domain-containing protein [Isosphaeraceae bacterium]
MKSIRQHPQARTMTPLLRRRRPLAEPLESRLLMASELTEGNASLWGSFAPIDRATTVVSNDATYVKEGNTSIHLRTESGFDTGVVYPRTNDANWDLTATNYLAFWSYSDNRTPIGFQGEQPVVVLNTASGKVTLTPQHTLTPKQGWQHFFVPLAGSTEWARTTTDAPDMRHVNSVEIHQDTWDYGFDIYYDGMQFLQLNPGPGSGAPPGVNPDAVKPRVLLYVFDPILENRGGRRTHEVYGWGDPATLTGQAIADLRASSHGMLDYQVVDTIVADVHPYYDDGTQLDDQTFEANWEGSPRVFPTGHFDYKRFVRENNLAARVDSGDIDEVWIYASPMGGMWESAMAGNGAYWINGPTQDVGSSRVFPIMGLNYERGVGEAIHSFGHRAEGTMDHSYGGQAQNLDTNWNRFTYQDRYAPGQGKGGVGNVHFPVNATSDYDYDNARSVVSDADDWANYPNFQGVTRTINAREWSPNQVDPQREYLNWWYSHMPHFAGKGPDGFLNNWWRYIGDLDQFKGGTQGQLGGTSGVAQAWVRGLTPGSTVGGVVPLKAEAVADGAIGRVDFYVDGRYIGTDTVAPYTVPWDTAGWAPGSHTVVARAYELQRQSEFASEPIAVKIPGSTPVPGVLAFAQSVAQADEGAVVQLVVTRSGGSDGQVTVAYATADGSARAGVNYAATSGVLVFPIGVTTQMIPLQILSDGRALAPLGFTVRLLSPGGGASLGEPSSAAITIANSDVPPCVTPVRVLTTIVRGRVTLLRIPFDGAINAVRARRTAAYLLNYANRRKGPAIALRSAAYDPRSRTVTLAPIQPFAANRPVQLRIRSGGSTGLTDTTGRAIDGDRDGRPGGDWVQFLGTLSSAAARSPARLAAAIPTRGRPS